MNDVERNLVQLLVAATIAQIRRNQSRQCAGVGAPPVYSGTPARLTGPVALSHGVSLPPPSSDGQAAETKSARRGRRRADTDAVVESGSVGVVASDTTVQPKSKRGRKSNQTRTASVTGHAAPK